MSHDPKKLGGLSFASAANIIAGAGIVVGFIATTALVWLDASKARAAAERLFAALNQTGTATAAVNTFYPLTRTRRLQSELDIYLNPDRALEKTEKWYISLGPDRSVRPEDLSESLRKLQVHYGTAHVRPAVSNNEAILAASDDVTPQTIARLCQVASQREAGASCGFVADTPPTAQLRTDFGITTKRIISWDRSR